MLPGIFSSAFILMALFSLSMKFFKCYHYISRCGSFSFCLEHKMILIDKTLKVLPCNSCSLWHIVQGRSSARRKKEGGEDVKFCDSMLCL